MCDEAFFVTRMGVHEWGNPGCDDCPQGYPRRCECGGLIHAEVESDGFTLKCDGCFERRQFGAVAADY